MKRFRISPLWWPMMAALSPALLPWLGLSTVRFYRGRAVADERNRTRIKDAVPLDLPVLKSLDLTVIVEHRTEEGFLGDAGVSYWLRGDGGSMLMDVGFGPERPAFERNAERLDIDGADVDSLFISHLHPDHVGGLRAVRRRRIEFPESFRLRDGIPVYLPAMCDVGKGRMVEVTRPAVFPNGFASTGPLARMLCLVGIVEEQAVVAHLHGRGLVIITGCGHPTLGTILEMVRRSFQGPIYAIVGGLHFPITGSRGSRFGIQFQQIIGTGKPWWARINDDDLNETINTINESGARKVLLSAHDTCDYALSRLQAGVSAETEILQAGARYVL